MKILEVLPETHKKTFQLMLDNLKTSVLKESLSAFSAIIEKHSDCQIYNMGLYYSAGSWSYCVPTFASEAGLTDVATDYCRHSPLTLDDQKTSLRWSPCDSPHHADEWLESLMPDTDDLLCSLASALDQIASYFSPEDVSLTDAQHHTLVCSIHEEIHSIVITALRAIARNPEIAAFARDAQCAVSLNAGDISQKEFLDDIKKINDLETAQRVAADLADAEIVSERESVLRDQKLKEERENPPQCDLSITDFVDVLEEFRPEFIEFDGGVFVDRHYDYPISGDSECETMANRFEVMDLLNNSKHFDEIDRLYGHFDGVNFTPDDLFPGIARALQTILREHLEQTFSGTKFMMYMKVDRMSLYHFTFCVDRENGFEFDLEPEDIKEGVEEVYRFGG